MVISIGLPLLMVKGQFHSLNSMTVENLETFIPFLVKCSINRAGARLIQGVPEWWSSIIKFQFPLKKPIGLSRIGYLRHLSTLVYSCYWYHKADYLLSFSAKIAADPKAVLFKVNNDNTTSIFSLHLDHVVKFSNENKNYDAQNKVVEKASKKLFLSPKKKTTSIPDIYLCDNCDAEFFSQVEMLKHEKVCYKEIVKGKVKDYDKCLYITSSSKKNKNFDTGKVNNKYIKNNQENIYGDSTYCDVNIREDNDNDSIEEIEVIKHIKHNIDSIPIKDKLFNYLGLEQNSNKNLAKLKRYAFTSPSKYQIKTYEKYLLKNDNIEFSSNLGKKMLEHFNKNSTNSRIIRDILWYESYCGLKTFSSKYFKPLRDVRTTRKKQRQTLWYHKYSFGKSQRIKRLNALKTGLNERSQRLLKQCKPLRIVLTRL